MMAGAGGAMRATGWRATAIRFQQFGEGSGTGMPGQMSQMVTERPNAGAVRH